MSRALKSQCPVLVLMGVSGCGKTTAGTALAKRLGWKYQEGDALHPPENISKLRAGQPLRDEDRAPWLAAVARWIDARRFAHAPGIVGCSALKRSYRDYLRKGRPEVWHVYLRVPHAELQRRVATRHHEYMPASLLESQLRTVQEPTAEEPRTLTVDASGTIAGTVDTILQRLREASCSPSSAWMMRSMAKKPDVPVADELAKARKGRIKVGIGGWNFPPWRDNFYPKGLPQRRELEYASRHLAAIEINSTFYRAQTPKVYARWRDETPAGFVFSLKAPRQIVELRKLAGADRLVGRFVFGGLAEFGERLGPIVWQFPPSRGFERDDCAAFLDLLPRELNGRTLRHALEVRNDTFLCDGFIELARALGVACVFTDSPDYPSFADLTGDFVYARLKRSRESEPNGYPSRQLGAWAARAKLWSEGGEPHDLPRVSPASDVAATRRDVFVYFISAAKARNPAAAMALQERIG